MGMGWISGDWKKDHNRNKVNLYIIEPLVESLPQVNNKITISGISGTDLLRD